MSGPLRSALGPAARRVIRSAVRSAPGGPLPAPGAESPRAGRPRVLREASRPPAGTGGGRPPSRPPAPRRRARRRSARLCAATTAAPITAARRSPSGSPSKRAAQVAGEHAAVVVDARRLPVAQDGDVVGEPVSLHRELRVIRVDVEHGLAGAQRERGGGFGGVGRLEDLGHPGERRLVVGGDRVLLAAEVAEERTPPDSGRSGDVVDGRVLVAALPEQLDGGRHEVTADLGAPLRRAAPSGGDSHGTQGSNRVDWWHAVPLRYRPWTPSSTRIGSATSTRRSATPCATLAEKEIAPHAAEVRRAGALPGRGARRRWSRPGSTPCTIPEEYGGQGADALARLHRDRGGRAGLRVVVADPGGQQAGLMPIMLSASDELKQQVLPSHRRRRGDDQLRAVRAGGGSDAAAMRTRARRDGDDWVLNGTKCWITNAGVSTWYTVMAVDRPGARGQRHLGVRRAPGRPGLRGRAQGAQARHQGLADPGDLLRRLPDPGRPDHRRARAPGSRRRCATLDHTRPTIGAQAVGIAQGALDVAIGYVKERKQFGKQLAEFQGLQFMIADMAMKIEAARQLVYQAAAARRAGRGEPGFISPRGQDAWRPTPR